jgi:cytosine permease
VAVGAVITWAVVAAPPNLDVPASQAPPANPWFRGFDIVVGYQVSWILMFADYSRYTRSEQKAAMAVFLGLLLTSLWMMPLGLSAARVAASEDPGAMMSAIGLGWAGAVLMVLATVTTNFVNIYMSGLAWKSLVPKMSAQASIWSIGFVGTALALAAGGWLDRYAEFMMVLGGLLVPVGGVLVAHYRLKGSETRVEDLYDAGGGYRGVLMPGIMAWALGAGAYYLASPWGGTMPSLVTAIAAYLLLSRHRRR